MDQRIFFPPPPHFVVNVVFSKCNKGIWKQYIRQLCTYYIASSLSPFIKRKYKSPKAIFQIIAGFQVYTRNASDVLCGYIIGYVSIFENNTCVSIAAVCTTHMTSNIKIFIYDTIKDILLSFKDLKAIRCEHAKKCLLWRVMSFSCSKVKKNVLA